MSTNRAAAFLKQAEDLARSGLVQPTWVVRRPADGPQWTPKQRLKFERDLAERLRQRHGLPPVLQEGRVLKPYVENRTTWVHRFLGGFLVCYAIWKALP